MDQTLADVSKRLDDLTELFRRRLLNDNRGQELLGELRAKSALDETLLVGRVLRPVATRLMNVIDRVDNWDGEADPLAESVRDEVIQILEDFGVEQIGVDGDVDPRRHRIESVVVADAPEGAITGRTVRGFELDGRVLRPAGVVVAAGPRAPGQNGAADD
ncbi:MULTISPECIES: nucleotide exchange factor GrpE [Gordonia]|uniref:Nucleotide exchange factor GrpE n=2 Tax=Gordonia TaxID=2053 RepID=L7LK96_9ACTN|nr:MULTISPECIES: nucleotide exchange factor GrpE [Gordonia]WFN92775.1 nucleotide exchange factor GrpE [Gordonia sihwensis]GAC61309.1 hypothetical protein GSI01S_16_00340 [Gordonia sihwensis NBRC 108236]